MRLCRQAASQAHLDAIETLIQMETNLKRSCSHCRGFKEGRPTLTLTLTPTTTLTLTLTPTLTLTFHPHR